MSAEQADAALRSRTVVEATIDGKRYVGKVVAVIREPSLILEHDLGHVVIPVAAEIRPPGRVS